MSDDLDLTWTCPYDGLETPDPSGHLQRAHGLSIEEVMEAIEQVEEHRKELERMLMMQSEMAATLGLATLCPLCGQEVSDVGPS